MTASFRVCVCTPTTGHPTMGFAHSLAQLCLYYSHYPVYPECAEQGIKILPPVSSSSVPTNREEMVVDALKSDMTHLAFIDDDMGFAPDILHILARKRVPLVGCNYSMKIKQVREFVSLALNGEDRIITYEHSSGLEPATYIGFGFALIAREVFEKLPRPWFPYVWVSEAQRWTTEDNPFCRAATKAGYTVYVDHDASKRVYHTGFYDYDWQEAVAYGKRTEKPPVGD